MDVLLYGIFAHDIVNQLQFANIPFSEILRTPFAINLGILGALIVRAVAQGSVRNGLIGLALVALTIMAGLVFTVGALFASFYVYGLARILARWSTARGTHGVPLLVGWIAVNAAYIPLFYLIWPHYQGEFTVGELVLMWGPAFFVFRSLHYIHNACKGRIDFSQENAFSRFLLYLLHFASFWFGPYQKFKQFDKEIDTCKQRQTRENTKEGFKRIGIGVVKFIVIFHVFNVPFFYKNDYFGPFADALFINASTSDPAHLWFYMIAFMFRITLFISALSDGVIGMNLLMGIRVPENANSPILATNVPEFWRRWHIQAMTFLRDEVFFPVGGLRNMRRGMFCVFAYSGFWHFPAVSSVLVFPLVQLLLFEATRIWFDFWKRHDALDDGISQLRKRLYLKETYLSGFLGWIIVFFNGMLSAMWIHDHFHGGSTILPRMLGL